MVRACTYLCSTTVQCRIASQCAESNFWSGGRPISLKYDGHPVKNQMVCSRITKMVKSNYFWLTPETWHDVNQNSWPKMRILSNSENMEQKRKYGTKMRTLNEFLWIDQKWLTTAENGLWSFFTAVCWGTRQNCQNQSVQAILPTGQPDCGHVKYGKMCNAIHHIAIIFRSSLNFGGEECTVPFVTYQHLVTQFQTNLGKRQHH